MMHGVLSGGERQTEKDFLILMAMLGDGMLAKSNHQLHELVGSKVATVDAC